MRIANENLIADTGAVSMGASFELRPVYLGHIAQYAIQLVFTGTPTGTLSLQCSNDPGHPNAQSITEQSTDVVNWTDISGSSQVITAAGNHTWNAENIGYRWVRVVYTRVSSTGSLTSAVANLKGV
jgi:hypothetical protein